MCCPGRPGCLFKPMADTMIFALIGSLIITLTFLPVLCAWFMRKGVREKRNKAFRMDQASATSRGWIISLAHPWRIVGGSGDRCWSCACCCRPSSARSSCRKLDEGALWVRATMPYTISYDEAAKITPKIRDVLASFPEVTTVASELGRPDDGTDSTGFFNVEFYVGLKPYSEWTGHISRQAGADRGHQPEASRLSRHHLQLHPARRGCGG